MVALRLRAMDVRSAVITYIAVHIRRESNFGVIGRPFPLTFANVGLGNMAATFVKGDKDCESATTDLSDVVTAFNEELILLSATLGIQAVAKLNDITEKVERVNEGIVHGCKFIVLTIGQAYVKYL